MNLFNELLADDNILQFAQAKQYAASILLNNLNDVYVTEFNWEHMDGDLESVFTDEYNNDIIIRVTSITTDNILSCNAVVYIQPRGSNVKYAINNNEHVNISSNYIRILSTTMSAIIECIHLLESPSIIKFDGFDQLIDNDMSKFIYERFADYYNDKFNKIGYKLIGTNLVRL